MVRVMKTNSEVDYVNLTNPIHEPKFFKLIPASELTSSYVPVDWLLETIIEQNSLNLLFGEPSSGKSLIALDWAFCMASGIPWNSLRTKKIDVIYIAGEGFGGLKRRLKALEVKYQCQAPEILLMSQESAQLSDPSNANWVANSIKKRSKNPGLVIIDTMHRNMHGDENSSQDIGALLHNIDRHLRSMGLAILFVHHSGHGQKDRSRGSSSIRAAMDAEFLVAKNDCGITLSCSKAKDFEAIGPLKFSIKTTKLDGWFDSDDEPVVSVYLDYEGIGNKSGKRLKLNARDEAILTSLSEATLNFGVMPTAEIKAKFSGFDSFIGEQKKIVHIDYWRELAYKAMTVDSDDVNSKAKKMAFKRCRDKLFNSDYTVEFGSYAWRIFKS